MSQAWAFRVGGPAHARGRPSRVPRTNSFFQNRIYFPGIVFPQHVLNCYLGFSTTGNWKLFGVKINLNLIFQIRGIKLPCAFWFSVRFNGLGEYARSALCIGCNFVGVLVWGHAL